MSAGVVLAAGDGHPCRNCRRPYEGFVQQRFGAVREVRE